MRENVKNNWHNLSEYDPAEYVAPTEDESVNLKSLFFIVLVFVYSKGVLVRIKMPLEVARTTRMVSRGWGLGRKFCCAFKSL